MTFFLKKNIYNQNGEASMGHFKSVSRKRKLKRKVVFIVFLSIVLFLIVFLFKNQLSVDKKTLKDFSLAYMHLNVKDETVFVENSHEKKEIIVEKKEKQNPTLYIYNTHQTEKYNHETTNEYGVSYDVLYASRILKNYLSKEGIISVVEESSIPKLLNEKNYNYGQSYLASRLLLEQSIIDNPSLNFFIDLHRDSSSYEATTCEIDGKKYAKILFVLGLENDNYEKNKRVINDLNERLKDFNSCLSRGIMAKEGPNVNGVYNQDFNENVILMEVGGQYNTIDEVDRILKIMAKILASYLGSSYE